MARALQEGDTSERTDDGRLGLRVKPRFEIRLLLEGTRWRLILESRRLVSFRG